LAQKLQSPLPRTAWRGMMVIVDRFAIQNAPSRCAYCGQPFEQDLYAWRSSSGKLYCSEFCADDEEEANFQNMRQHDEPAAA
jgi:hypothetical protein